MSIPTTKSLSRRKFNQSVLAVGASTLAAPAFLRGQSLNNKLNIAVIGAGGRGAADTAEVKSENIVALCDVNAKSLDAAGVKFPKARKFSDFRELFDKAANEFDAVVIATCEHTHAAATMLALKHNKHVYCEKPLTHDVWEARQIRETAAKTKLATQMGIQIHATENYHRVVELVRSGVVGPIREVHVWVSRAWGYQAPEDAKKARHRRDHRTAQGGNDSAGFDQLGLVDRPRAVSTRSTRFMCPAPNGIAGGTSAMAR